ncbi:hypothetical protein ABEB36_015350 [Hypothenemus hampei]|uniref:Uncharacterized protein n=1 Tax=Hypothenemus hampei TaxID=57062 RepID=A0ABD1E2M9_HYPHA
MGKNKRSRSKTPSGEPPAPSRKRSRRDLEGKIRELEERLKGRHSRPFESPHSVNRSPTFSRDSPHHHRHSRADTHKEVRTNSSRDYPNRHVSKSPTPGPSTATLHSSIALTGTSRALSSHDYDSDSMTLREYSLSNQSDRTPLVERSDNKDRDHEILGLLGENKPRTSPFKLHPIVHKLWANTLANGLEKEEKQELFDKFLIPEDLLLGSPGVNQEVSSAVPASALKNDKFYQLRQSHLGKAASALGRALNITLAPDFDYLHFRISLARRKLLTPHLNVMVMDLSNKAPIGELLFGPDLGAKIKEAKTLQQASTHIRGTSNVPTGKSLNWRGPPRSRGNQGTKMGRQPQRRSQPQRNYPPPHRRI